MLEPCNTDKRAPSSRTSSPASSESEAERATHSRAADTESGEAAAKARWGAGVSHSRTSKFLRFRKLAVGVEAYTAEALVIGTV